jgi:uncharacterized protein YndB with AHSA1/START domain
VIPALRRQLVVPVGADVAFDAFTDEIGLWWPVGDGHSVFGEGAAVVWRDGRLVETAPDGREPVWGTVLHWEPPHRLRLTWHPGRTARELAERPSGSGVGRRSFAAGPAILAGVLTVAFVATGLAVDRFDQVHPAPTQLMYALDADTDTAYWASSDAGLPWTHQYVSKTADLSDKFPILKPDLVTGPADAADLAEPSLTVAADQTFDGLRTVTVLIKPQRTVRLAYLKVTSDQTVVGPRRPVGRCPTTSSASTWACCSTLHRPRACRSRSG